MERPNTVAGLVEKHAALVKYRDQLEADIRAATGCNDTDRAAKAIAGTVGRRLMYARPDFARA